MPSWGKKHAFPDMGLRRPDLESAPSEFVFRIGESISAIHLYEIPRRRHVNAVFRPELHIRDIKVPEVPYRPGIVHRFSQLVDIVSSGCIIGADFRGYGCRSHLLCTQNGLVILGMLQSNT